MLRDRLRQAIPAVREVFELKVDGIEIVYGEWVDRFIATNFKITTSDGRVWEPMLVSDAEFELSTPERREEITVALNRDTASRLAEFLISKSGRVEVKAVEVDIDAQSVTDVFEGEVTKFKLDPHTVELTVESVISKGLDTANRVRLTTGCIHKLFDAKCGLSAADFRVVGTVTSISGRTVAVSPTSLGPRVPASPPDNWFKYGKITIKYESRMIVSSSSFSVTVQIAFRKAEVGDEAYLYAGCDKKLSTCRDKFDNVSHFLGFPHTPTENASIRGRQGHMGGGKK